MRPHPLDNARLIGLSGHIGAGKTTVARYLQTRYPDLERRSFAENLRHVLSVLTGVPVEETRSAEQKERRLEGWDATVGQLLQDIGQAMREMVHRDAWLLSLFSTYDATRHRWILEDVRHINEAECVRRQGGILIRLEGDPGLVRARSTRDLTHESEVALDGYAYFDVVLNSEAFFDDLDALYDEIGRQLREREKEQ